MKTIAYIQARCGSKRFPSKVLMPIYQGKCSIELIIERLQRSNLINEIVIATSTNPMDKSIGKLVGDKCKVFYGEENNVLDRFYNAVKQTNPDIIVRITADCPLVDYNIVDACITHLINNDTIDYVSNTLPPTFPDGFDVEVFTRVAFEKCFNSSATNHDYEHVTPWLRKSNKICRHNIEFKKDISNYRLTFDDERDFEIIKKVFDRYGESVSAEKLLENLTFLDHIHAKVDINERNYGLNSSSNDKVYKRAKKVLLNGGSLLSKRPEMFLKNGWPAYFSKSKGCSVWDLDGKHYYDFGLMGVGTNTLGYGDEIVDAAVANCVSSGNMSSLNSEEEVLLAERLVNLHPWASFARFARSGGEANAIALRIARSVTGPDKSGVAVCGYHGWHDWYIALNCGNQQGLDDLLLPGLNPTGVPERLGELVKPFVYSDFESFKAAADHKNIGVVFMEFSRTTMPDLEFLKSIREYCTKNHKILIFDECSSGFRENIGGIHMKHNIFPDLAMFGKALGNGYAITAVLAAEFLRDRALNSFISSTFWTERIGYVAALNTLNRMEELNSAKRITKIGAKIKNIWVESAFKAGIEINVSGLDALAGFGFCDEKISLHLKSIFTKKMLDRGFLAPTACYSSISHTEDLIELYKIAVEETFFEIKELLINGEDEIIKYANDIVCHGTFKRLN